ncbi:MAG: class I SAM-dependent methyltransferase [Pseudomonadota bacterium]|jgi:SAM-dependent methyltransferase
MAVPLQHAMKPTPSAEDIARQRFVSGLRTFVLNDLAADMRRAYDTRVVPSFRQAHGREPENGAEVHEAMRPDPAFKAYSSLRVSAQKMVWDSVTPVVQRDQARLAAIADEASQGRVEIHADFKMPRNVSAIDVHFMPGSYSGAGPHDDVTPGAVYDQGLAVFSMGLMGKNLDDIGVSMSRYVSRRFPEFRPLRILDLGCTVGHNTLPWKQTYPDAEVIGTDVAPGGLKYGAARAALQGVDVTFRQMNAEQLAFENDSFDLVFTSMFLHELSLKTIGKVFAEIRRVLKPGGLMLHMELPPNTQMGPFEGFYLDWDCYYNVEPFYKAFRDQEPRALCEKAGFEAINYFQFVVPSVGSYGSAAVDVAIAAETHEVNKETTGRLAEGIQWFGFGAWKTQTS